MERSEIQSLLNEGIGAVRRGDLARGRELLLRVVEADEGIEPAWMWLSTAVEAPADKLVALENALALNPSNSQARSQREALRKQLGMEETERPPETVNAIPPASSPPPASIPLSTPAYAAYQAEDDPYQCAYCGWAAGETDERCPHCGRSLLVAGPWKGGTYQYLALIFTGLDLQAAFVQAVVMYFTLNFPDSLRILPGAAVLSDNLFAAAVVRVGVWAIVALMLLTDMRAVYPVAAAAALLDMGWAGLGYFLGQVGQILAAVNAVFAAGIFLIAAVALVSLSQARVRLRVVLDKDARGAWMLYKHGQMYGREGKWALAVLHWRRAIALHPHAPEFYRDLGRAQMQLRRYPQALEAFRSGAALAPDDPELKRLIESARARATTRSEIGGK